MSVEINKGLCTGCGATVTQKPGRSILLWYSDDDLVTCALGSSSYGSAHWVEEAPLDKVVVPVELPPVAIKPELSPEQLVNKYFPRGYTGAQWLVSSVREQALRMLEEFQEQGKPMEVKG